MTRKTQIGGVCLHRDFLVISGTASNIIKETCRYMKLWCNYLVTRFADIPDTKVLNLFARYIPQFRNGQPIHNNNNDNKKCIVQEPILINDLARAKAELKLKQTLVQFN